MQGLPGVGGFDQDDAAVKLSFFHAHRSKKRSGSIISSAQFSVRIVLTILGDPMPFTAAEIAACQAHTDLSFDALRSRKFSTHLQMDPNVRLSC